MRPFGREGGFETFTISIGRLSNGREEDGGPIGSHGARDAERRPLAWRRDGARLMGETP
jgi:hypothetical protein